MSAHDDRATADLERRLPVDPDLPSPPRAHAASPFGLGALTLVGAGGALGTLARYELTNAWTTPGGAFPSTIFAVNCVGAFAIGLVLTLLAAHRQMGGWRLFTCVGILGGWTTMSSLVVATDQLIADGRAGTGLGYAAGSIALGIVATALGVGLGLGLAGRRR